MVSLSVMPESVQLTARDYQDAMDSQSACNLVAILGSFHDVAKRLMRLGYEDYRKHPICRMYAEQIAFLTGGGCCTDNTNYSNAYDDCLLGQLGERDDITVPTMSE